MNSNDICLSYEPLTLSGPERSGGPVEGRQVTDYELKRYLPIL